MAYREQKKWYESPWVWVTSGCCLGCILVPLLIVGIFGAGVFYLFRSTGVRDEAIARARAHPAVIEALGEPVEAGWMLEGTIDIHGDPGDHGGASGEAEFSLPLSGPQGKGRLYVRAERYGEDWEFQDLYVVVKGRDAPIDLLEGPEPEQVEAPEGV